jgi:two-component system, sensor histidine kinase
LTTAVGANHESDAHRALAIFLLKTTPNGRFLHYCWSRSRKRALLIRQSLTFVACVTMAVLQTPLLGLLGFLTVVCSDLCDTFWMRHVWTVWRREIVPKHVRMLTFATGVLQTTTMGLATVIMYLSVRGDVIADMQLEFFGVAYLVGVGMNVGLVRPLVPMIAKAKLGVVLMTFLVILFIVLKAAPTVSGWFVENAYLVSAILILVLVANSFLLMVDDNYARNVAAQETVLRNQVALTEANTEIAIREQQARRLALIAESTDEAIFVTDAEGKVSWITGYASEDVIGRRPGSFKDTEGTDPNAIARIYESRRTGEKARLEILNRKKDGSKHWINTTITPVFDAEGKLMMCIQVERDVTEEKRRTQQLADMNEEAKAAAKVKEQFFATMSHEIRTPMNGVLGMADLLARTELNEEQQGYLTAIRQSGDALLGIINDILDLSKLQSGKVQVVKAAFDLVDVVSGVVKLLSPLAQEKAITLEIKADAEQVIWVMGDSGRVRQVLINLIGNAIKFTRTGGVTVQLLFKGNGIHQIVVTDTGIGITEDRLEAIFDSFTQADSAIDRQFGGTGLGLTISRMLARAMGGEVSATSRVGQGSSFALTLPLPAAAAVAPEALTPVVQEVRWVNEHARILIAEDNGTNRLILRKMLEPTKAKLTEVTNGKEAVTAYSDATPDLVIMDMQMPVMDGLTAIRQIRQIERSSGLRRCPVLVLSANVFQQDILAGYAADCDDYLTKPVQRDALLQRVALLLRHGNAEQALPSARRLA